MKRLLLACLALPVALGACKKRGSDGFAGIVFDIGGIDDKSFNESAHRGLMRAKSDLGVAVEWYSPEQAADRKTGLRRLCGKKFKAVLGIGFMFTDDILAAAKDFPDIKFACVDMVVPPEMPPNVVALNFREEQGSFLVGAVAGLVTQTRKVGFIGGIDDVLIHKFEAGYRAGVKRVAPDVEIFVNYAGTFMDPEKGKSLALGQYKSGADIIYHASGKTGLGVFTAAQETNTYAIGVDSDQHAEAPGRVITSMIKRVDVAVFEMVKGVKEGKFQGGVRLFGLEDDAVGIVYDDRNKDLIPRAVYDRVMDLRKEIIAGKIRVPTTR